MKDKEDVKIDTFAWMVAHDFFRWDDDSDRNNQKEGSLIRLEIVLTWNCLQLKNFKNDSVFKADCLLVDLVKILLNLWRRTKFYFLLMAKQPFFTNCSYVQSIKLPLKLY